MERVTIKTHWIKSTKRVKAEGKEIYRELLEIYGADGKTVRKVMEVGSRNK